MGKDSIKKTLFVEIADTPSKREQGLMYRKSLSYNEGMLFKFPHAEVISFWMKNTYIPLDIAFIDNNGKIFQIEQMSPLSYRQIRSNNPCKFALETNRGWFAKNNVEVGDHLTGIYFGNQIRKAQDMKNIQNIQGQQIQPNMPLQPGMQGQEHQPEQPNAEVTITFSDKEKIKYANERGLKLSIVYVSKNGFYVGPRTLSPVPQDGNKYPIEHGPSGELFKGYDESPTLTGHNFSVEGGKPKSFLFDGIIKLEVLGRDGKPVQFINGQPYTPVEKPKEQLKPEPNENDIKMQIKKFIPFLQDKQWESIKKEVMAQLKNGFGIADIAKKQILNFLNIFKGK